MGRLLWGMKFRVDFVCWGGRDGEIEKSGLVLLNVKWIMFVMDNE